MYDENGQVMNASFMDYLIPQATDMPEEVHPGSQFVAFPVESAGDQGCW